MGLDQYIYVANFKKVKESTYNNELPDHFLIKRSKDIKDPKNPPENVYIYESEKCPELFDIEDLRKNNLLQGYFEREHGIENCEYVRITQEDIDYLLETCNKFLSYFNQDIKNKLDDYFQFYDDDFDELDEEFLKIIENNPECQKIVNEALPITEGFFYGEYDLNIWYYGSIKEIQKLFRKLNQEKEDLSDYEDYYYSCWY